MIWRMEFTKINMVVIVLVEEVRRVFVGHNVGMEKPIAARAAARRGVRVDNHG